MVKVFVDTNVLLDIAFDRRPQYTASAKVFSKVEKKELRGCISALTCANMYYLIEKQSREAQARDFIKSVVRVFEIISIDQEIIEKSLDRAGDVEDNIQALSANRAEADYIVTRNLKDFKKSEVKVITPEELLSLR